MAAHDTLRPAVTLATSFATADDLPAIARLHIASWRVAYKDLLPADLLASLSVDKREQMWRQVLAEGKSELMVARGDGAILGFVSYGATRDSEAPAGRGEIWAIYVDPSAWSRGIGRGLCAAALERLRAMDFTSTSLWVLVGNERAIRFYGSMGFAAEAGSEKEFVLGGARVREVRFVSNQPE